MKPHYISLKPLIPWKEAARPIDWQQRFGRMAPLEVEIGFGNGEFLVRHAQAHPERDFAGIDQEWPSVQRALRKIAQANLPNVRLIRADAQVALERLFRPQSVHRVYSLFPCPWPKARHAGHRLFSRAFLNLLNSRLATGAEVQIATDHRPYLDWLLEQTADSGFDVRWQAVPARLDTKYERKWQQEGQTEFFELWLAKHSHQQAPLKEDIALKTYHVAHFDPHHFRPTGEHGEVTVEFKESLYDPRRRKAMIRVFVAEEHFKQEIWLQITRREPGWHIGLARGCGFVPTVGVQRALDLARDAACPTNDLEKEC